MVHTRRMRQRAAIISLDEVVFGGGGGRVGLAVFGQHLLELFRTFVVEDDGVAGGESVAQGVAGAVGFALGGDGASGFGSVEAGGGGS